MSRLKIGLVLAGLLAVMATSAAPAFALFETDSATKLSGEVLKANIAKTGEFLYSAGNTVQCPAKSITIKWSVPSQKGATQQYKINWGTECTAEIGGNKLSAILSDSDLEVSSPERGKAKYEQLKTTILTTTNITAGPCMIIVPSIGNGGREKIAQTSPNLTSFEETVAVNAKGFTAETTKGTLCTLATKTTGAEIKEFEFKLTGQGQR